MKLVVSQSALADLNRLRAFLVEKNPNAAQRAATALIGAIDSLILLPDRGRPTGSNDTRDLLVSFGRAAYLVRYVYDRERDEIIILRVWHGREASV